MELAYEVTTLPDENSLTAQQAAEYLGITSAAIYVAANNARLSGKKIDNHWRFTKEVLDEYRLSVSKRATRPSIEPPLIAEQQSEVETQEVSIISTREYAIKRFVEHLVQQDQLALAQEQEKSARLLYALKSIREGIDLVMAEYE